jgi:hypothetical protein
MKNGFMTMLLVMACIPNVFSSPQKSKKEPEWKTGKVLDSRVAKSSVATGATTNTSGTANTDSTGQTTINATGNTHFDFTTIRENQLVILGDEFAYVIEDTRVTGGHGAIGIAERAIANRKHGCRFIVGDNVKFWQEKAVLHVRDADDKECKTDILRQERLK